MALALSIADNGNGTGGVATVSGADTGTAVTVYASPYAGIQQNLTWTSAGSRTGNGTVAVLPGLGQFFWYATGTVSAAPALSNVTFQALTDNTQSVHYRCLAAYQARIQGLNLTDMPSSSIVIRWLPRKEEGLGDTLPLITLSPVGREGQPGILNNRDDIEYPVLMAIIDKNNRDLVLNIPRNTLWRQQIFRAFRHQRLAGVPEIITTDVQPNYIVDPSLIASNYFYSTILFQPRSREVRG